MSDSEPKRMKLTEADSEGLIIADQQKAGESNERETSGIASTTSGSKPTKPTPQQMALQQQIQAQLQEQLQQQIRTAAEKVNTPVLNVFQCIS